MENNLSKTNVIHLENDKNVFSFKHKNGISLTVCFCQCDCHKSNSQTNIHKNKKTSNNNNNNNLPNLKSNSFQRNSFSKIYTNPIKKDYSFDYYNNNTEINPKMKETLSKDSVDRKIYLRSRSDINLEERTDDLVSKDSIVSNQRYEELKQNLNKKQNLNNDYNYSNNEFILYRNDIKSFNKFINTLHEIKNRERKLPRCSSLKDFGHYNTKYLNNNTNKFSNNYQDIYLKKNYKEEDNINIVYDNNYFIQDKKSYDNNIKKMKKNLSIEYKNNNNNFLLNDNINNCKTSQRKKAKNNLSQNYVGNRLLNQSKSKKDFLYNNYNNNNEIFSTNREHNNNNNNYNKLKDYNALNYKEDIIQDFNYNNYDYIDKEKIQANDNNALIDKNLNPLGHIVDNFVTMLKYKNGSNNRNKMNKNKVNGKVKYGGNKYNDNIMKKKKNLDNMCLAKTKQKSHYTYYKYKDYSSLENKIKNIENQNKKNLKRKNEIKEKKDEYEKKYGKNNFINFNNRYCNEKIVNNNKKKINKLSGIYDNNKMYKFNKYNDESTSKSKKYSTNYSIRENDNINQNYDKEKYIEENNYYQIEQYPNINNNNYDNNNNNDNINNIYDYSNIELNKENKDDNINIINDYSNIELNKDNNKDNNIENNNYVYCPSKIYNKSEIETFNNNSIQNGEKENINNYEINAHTAHTHLNDIYNNSKSYEFQFPHSKTNKNIEIQNISNISYYPTPHNYNDPKNNTYIMSRQNIEQTQISYNPINNIEKKMNKPIETVSEKVRKLIKQKAKNNNNYSSLSSKLNLDTNLSLSDENENERDHITNTIKRNIAMSPKTVFTIYNSYEKPIILAFDIENKTFSFQDYSDFGDFEENYKLSLSNNDSNNFNKNKGNLFITIDTNLYIVTGKNYDMLYMFDSIKKTMIKLCNLQNNHSNGNLLNYEENIICLSGDFNKKVEIYSIKKNEWNNLPEMLIERSNSASCIINNKNNKYILNVFGFNSPTKEYLNTIEYLDVNKNDSYWKYLYYNNPNLILLNISNLFCINYEDHKIIIIGGHNENEKKNNDKFIQMVFDVNNFGSNAFVEISERKLKDIDYNKKYCFYNGCKNFFNEDKNEIFYEVFDNEYNCHLFQRSNLAHDVFYFQY